MIRMWCGSTPYAQPFLLVNNGGARTRRHIPDFLLVTKDGGVSVVDVKPKARLVDSKVIDTFSWAGEVIAARGWGFEVWSEPSPQVLANVRFLAGYRRPESFSLAVLDDVLDTIMDGQSTVRGIEHLLAARWPRLVVRSHLLHLLHLLWRGDIVADLEAPLDGATRVRRVAA